MDEAVARSVNLVPSGRVVSYGVVGQSLPSPVSGLLVGRAMQRIQDVPWWRVVLASGGIATARRDPALGAEQRHRLLDEGVKFDGENVAREFFLSLDELLDLAESQPNRPEM